jgi:hypothetical protein
MADPKQFRIPTEILEYLERIEDEFCLPSRNAALLFVLNQYLKSHPTKGRTYAERKPAK